MGYHSFRDSLFCSLHGVKLAFSGGKFFSKGIESPTLSELYASAFARVPQISKVGLYEIEGGIGTELSDPSLHVLQWMGEGFPVVLYHHISNEHPLDGSCRKIFLNHKHPFRANIVLLQASHHTSSAAFSECIKELYSFAGMIALSARVIEEVVKQFSSRGMPVIVCGVKLGGWVTNLHHALSNSAAAYIPMLAGAGFGDIFIDSKFSSCVSSLARKNHQKIRRTLNFDDLFMARGARSNVYPLLAVHDQIALLVRQRPAYGDIKFSFLEKGHITGASAYTKLRAHCFSALSRIKS
jgi:hypothetical protein